ncbi:MAG TPA: DUF1549 domain-containing protein, partial [Planctomycetaceae bacterium]|nr:DUF1549 domain-containing protein [Planctomycetaceae bacterium]
MRVTLFARALLLLLLISQSGFAFGDDKPAEQVDPDHVRKQAEGLKLFKSDVRGILLDHCASCHGVDSLEGEFDLTSREALLKGTPTNKVLDLKNIPESELWQLVSRQKQPYMPFEDDPLPKRELELLKKWLELGAPYDKPLVEKAASATRWQETKISESAREFWSFKKLQPVTPPRFVDDSWNQTEIDRFILHKLSEKGIHPNPTADRRTLIRRAYFDLIGLPPQPEEIDSLVNDPDPEAYPKLIDKLLASEHFGERWARHWLDVARFAESHGFEQDYDRPHAYHFRDFVIQAFNEDMPYDQFVRWQLAGDELAPDDPQALMATGFLGAGVFPTQITANEVERTRYDALDDMAATTSNAFLGLSVGCARCHDHKFDPIPQADYYRFVSTFTTTVRSNVDVDMTPDKTAAALAAWEQAHRPKVDAQKQYETEHLSLRFEEWLTDPATDWKVLSQRIPWLLLEIAEAKSKNGATLSPQADGSVLASGTNPDEDIYTLTTGRIGPLAEIKTLRLEALAHDSFVKHGPGRADNGNFALSHIKLFLEDADGKNRKEIKLTNPRADFQQNEGSLSIASSLDDNPKSGWAVDPQFGKDHWALFDIDPIAPLDLNDKQRLVVELSFAVNTKHAIGRARLSISTQPDVSPDAGSQSIALGNAIRERRSLGDNFAKLSPSSRDSLWNHYRSQDERWVALNSAVQKSLSEKPQPNLVKMMIASEGVTPIRHHTQG